jgi:hypothetical protein
LHRCPVEEVVMQIANMNTILKDLETWAKISNKAQDFLNET